MSAAVVYCVAKCMRKYLLVINMGTFSWLQKTANKIKCERHHSTYISLT